ncbi:MAG: 50S ribosomal protein L16, partial [Candidatus Peregrinibacteria bacterium]
MLQPRKQKHRKEFRRRGCEKGVSRKGSSISFGTYGLKAQSSGEVTSRQLEAARRAMTRSVKRGGKIWTKIYPHKPVTRKASEVPMGSGKGAPDHFVSVVKPGRIIFEMEGVEEEIAREAMRLA